MFKAFATAAAILTVSASGAMAAEVGVRHSAGYEHNTVTHGRAWNSYSGTVNSRGIEVNGAGGGLTGGRGGAGAGSFDITRTRSVDRYRGGSSNHFSGGSGSTFSESSVFAR